MMTLTEFTVRVEVDEDVPEQHLGRVAFLFSRYLTEVASFWDDHDQVRVTVTENLTGERSECVP